MPLQKYYCDYCDKQFQDTPTARKRHIQGLHHIRARSLWFDSLRLSGTPTPFPVVSVLPDCDVLSSFFGFLLEKNNAPAAGDAAFERGVCNRFVKTGFCQYGDSCKYVHPKGATSTGPSAGTIAPGNVVSSSVGIAWENLPPSLRPPPDGAYGAQPFVDWG